VWRRGRGWFGIFHPNVGTSGCAWSIEGGDSGSITPEVGGEGLDREAGRGTRGIGALDRCVVLFPQGGVDGHVVDVDAARAMRLMSEKNVARHSRIVFDSPSFDSVAPLQLLVHHEGQQG
jgi:hypothetical protein